MAAPHHLRQSSLEGVLDFSSSRPLEPDQLHKATDIFNRVVAQYEPNQKEDNDYKRITLLRLIHDSVISKDSFLSLFFLFVERELRQGEGLSEEKARQEEDVSKALRRYVNMDSWSEQQQTELETSLASFSDHLVNKFFLPLRASALKTPPLTPASLSCEITPFALLTGAARQPSKLQRDCLIRDGHRCVISHKFDLYEAKKRFKRDSNNARDDDGRMLSDEKEIPEYLEVAHIFPHSLTSLTVIGKDSFLNEAKKLALQILNMFDPDIIHLIEGSAIDRPSNALTLTNTFRRRFGDFEISFESTTDEIQHQHTYKIDSVHTIPFLRPPSFPAIRTLRLSPNRTIDPPSARLLAVHHAIARILHLSAAGSYIDTIIYDMDNEGIDMDGSTASGHYLDLKLGGWLDGVSIHYGLIGWKGR